MTKLIFEKSSEHRSACDFPFVKEKNSIPKSLLKESNTSLGLPELSELEIIRHYVHLASLNFNIEKGLYPLGSCTMKYNPRINEDMAGLSGFSNLHPYAPQDLVQGALKLMYEVEQWLCELTGMSAVTLQPAAGAQGEFTGLKLIRAYHLDKGLKKTKILIPDSAHGTNPASSTLCGYDVQKVPSNSIGLLDIEQVSKVLDDDVAALMMTNPNTLGLFEENIVAIAKLLHQKNALLYCDGANFNALMGQAKLAEMGVDVLQFNLHKTFSTPHGGGGPGAGPVGVTEKLKPYLPLPRVIKEKDFYKLETQSQKSIGRLKGFYGNFGVLVRAYTYMRAMGQEGLKKVSQMAVLNANYIKHRLKDAYDLPYNDRPCMHEVIFSDKKQLKHSIKTLDIAKRLMDFGFHPPTVYFPLIVSGALMIEPTETESKEEIDRFCDAMIAIAKECESNPQKVHEAPHTTPVRRVDEVKAARNLILTYQNPTTR
ncbi:MAG: glycine dehydrogenase (aminomethyl-transferring) [Deltaproteobacteria bacterium GWA2_38_16]|nr:MAG: glycine dehydrogenase (aminomethyl-transferring) [Deltaproteobacteria bacterium GWA2_38_16]OGQ03559.1 MAG: glycine dehydrogenase (aminomethyl-transferring) [Deltaproteobacteria bacterium RIFCSPHIGHO2_02_FULL_38_15]OGQ33259.1 MAG: glycine dehydrogenase (aminomethyl-transferring) [Deltaproteobacteria bacterium RIFCSPLOWO2_01_FULL_38_9]OGQ61426.1 MAG: glycine dehydrogenase (aminomethyl-transferring) [Deltaproteobacteria bacterium RIFCSPLOWO2_12_FULL_38_8]HBQ21199.1 aminomethyl-transferring